MRRSGLPSWQGGRWDGLLIDASGPKRPGLRVEVAGRRRFLIRQADRVVLLARQRADYYGVFYARTGLYRSPLPPISAAHARRVRETSADDDAWAARWAYQFTEWLQTTVEGPLHNGSWILAHGMPGWGVAAHWQRLHAVDPGHGHITWFGYGDPDEDQRDVLPLRPLSPVDADRVRSYRRQLREGILPPALLWWVSGLDTLLVLDGHDRITAALAEQVVPEVTVLAPAVNAHLALDWQHRAIKEYVNRVEHLKATQANPFAPVQIASLSRQFAATLTRIARAEGRTRAWHLPGGRAAWDQQARQLTPDWTSDLPAATVSPLPQEGRRRAGPAAEPVATPPAAKVG